MSNGQRTSLLKSDSKNLKLKILVIHCILHNYVLSHNKKHKPGGT
jgi:hypothetical protein